MLLPIWANAQTGSPALQQPQPANNEVAAPENPSADNGNSLAEPSNTASADTTTVDSNHGVNTPPRLTPEGGQSVVRRRSLPPAQPTFDPPKRRRGTGFFIQGGVNMSLHRF